jgi:hypothetical protein
VCEWAAHSAQPGGYYALIEETFSGGLPGTTVSNLELVPVVGSEGEAAAALEVEPQTVCRLAVPALNVRSGPGLAYEIIKKVRSTGVEIATVLVVGRTDDASWLQVDERVADGGWVIAGSEYLTCDGDLLSLPVVPADQLPPTPTPLPIVQESAVPAVGEAPAAPVDATAPPADATAPADATPVPANPAIPEGLAQLTVTNAFDREMRFTLDQRYRVQEGPSEYDLQPGQSVTLLVYAGPLAFTASSPWNELAGNAQIEMAPDQARAIAIFWYYDAGEDIWVMQIS